MDETKKISEKSMVEISNEKGFVLPLMTKDHYVTLILYLLKDVEGIYFKGGTALQKIFLNYSRLSEDADYTVTGDIEQIRSKIEQVISSSGFFERISKDKDVENFVRLIAAYKDFRGEEQTVFIDLNKRAKLLSKPEKHKIHHFYSGFIPEFSVNTLSVDEMVAEKMAATIGRNKPRDHFDLYKIIKKGMKINLDHVKEKCKSSGVEFDIIKMFNNAQKLKRRWDEDMIPLLAEEITFQEVMTTLAKHFNLKKEKDASSKSKKSKRGDSQVDWVIAGSIFILFLSYFFITVKPIFFTSSNEQANTEFIEDKLKTELFWEIKKVPLLIGTQKYFDSYPLRAKIVFADGYSDANIAFSDNTTSFVDAGYFFAVKSINISSYFDVAFSNQTYEQGNGTFEMTATSTNISTHNLNAKTEDSLITEVNYLDFVRISDIKIYAGDYLLVPESRSFTDAKLLGKYNAQFGNLNNTYYIYAGSSIIDQRIDSQYETTVNIALQSYYYYYIDRTIDSAIAGNATGCFAAVSDSAIFYNQGNGLMLSFSEPLLVSFCMDQAYALNVNISVGKRNEMWIRYLFYEGNISEAQLQRQVSSSFGIPRTVSGISLEKLVLLNMTSYQTLKADWNYPKGKDFRIDLANSSTGIGPNLPEINIFAKTFDTYFLDKFGMKTPARFSLEVW